MKREMIAKASVSLAETQKKIDKLKTSIADLVVVDDDDDFDWSGVLDNLSYQFRYVNQDIQNLYSMIYQHINDGHLPPIEGADRMTKALDVLGLAGDYNVQKKTIYASNGKPEKWVVELTPKKNA